MNTSINTSVKFLTLFGLALVLGIFFLNRSTLFPSELPHNKRNKPPSQTIKSAGLMHSLKPFASNQWFSSIAVSFPSEPLFAMPIAYRLTADGLAFSYPDVVATEKTVFGSFVEDFTVGTGDSVRKSRITQLGDWHIGLELSGNTSRMNFTIAHGIPFTNIQSNTENFLINIPNEYKLFNRNDNTNWEGDKLNTSDFVLVTREHSYLIVMPEPREIVIRKNKLTIPATSWLFIGLLPSRQQFDNFKKIAGSEINKSQADFSVEGDTLRTTYRVETSSSAPLVALYPHQYDNIDTNLNVLGTYKTIRGDMQLIQTNEFTTTIDKTIPAETFSPLQVPHQDVLDAIKKDTDEIIKKGPPNSQDYFLGTWFGKVSTLLQLSETAGLTEETQKLRKFVEPLFIASLSKFSYDEKTTSLVADKPEFGNEKVNDHHFHYGYYIRTAAILARFNPDIVKDIKEPVDAMVRDIATTDRTSDRYPYLRNFDIYEGHSWADGSASFGDGNNQESSSEAMNAWYSLYLWSKVTENSELEKYALYLYNTEMRSIFHYWFNKNKVYGEPYKHAIASIVWGGKVDFATWFSSDVNMIYGIQLLPFTPASSYLGKLPNFLLYDDDYHKYSGNEEKPWGDLFVMWKSYYYPEKALEVKDKVQKLEDANTRSLFLYTLYKNAEKAD